MNQSKQRTFPLLFKAMFVYILFSLVFFVLSGLVLQNEANKLVYKLLENRFEHRQEWITRNLKRNPEKEMNHSQARVKKVEKIPENSQPFYIDTLMVNDQTSLETMTRKKTGYLEIDGRYYKYEFFIEVGALYQFKDDIFRILFVVFAMMAVVLFLGNYLLSTIIFEPFRKILKKMEKYRIGDQSSTHEINTSTAEFDQLRTLFESMKKRIENDYYQLKEYTENMSHELQTPLSVIQNKIESLISESDIAPNQVKKLKVVYDEVTHLSRLGSTLNLITKIENNEFNNIISVKTEPVINDHLKKVEDLALLKGVRFNTQLSGVHYLTIDPGLLDVLLRNLIKNAIHYSVQHTEIRINSTQKELVISNEGPALDFPKESIFNRYKKGNGKNSLGLGLAIVKKICTINGFEISYEFVNGRHSFIIN